MAASPSSRRRHRRRRSGHRGGIDGCRLIGPGIIALGLLASPSVWRRTGRRRSSVGRRSPVPAAAPSGVAAARDRRDRRRRPRLDGLDRARSQPGRDGALVGQRLCGRASTSAARPGLWTCPAESFAAGPFGRVVLVGDDDGATLAAASRSMSSTGCTSSVAEEAAVIRRATISPDGDTVFETRVDRALAGGPRRLATTARRRPGRRPGRSIRPDADARFGRTWSTEFAWSVDGDRARHPVLRRGRLPDARPRPVGGSRAGRSRRRPAARADGRPHRGHASSSYRACRGLPCPLVAVDVESATRTPLSEAAGAAVLTGRGATARVVHEAAARPVGACGPSRPTAATPPTSDRSRPASG